MSRLIDADALQNEYKQSHEGKRLLLIDAAPTIIPERKRGKWETIEQQPYFRKHYKRICCSECKRRSEGDIKWNFCPNCGAKMKEGETEC